MPDGGHVCADGAPRRDREPLASTPRLTIETAANAKDFIVTLDREGSSAAVVAPPARDEPDLRRLRQGVDASGEVIFMTDCEGVLRDVPARRRVRLPKPRRRPSRTRISPTS